MLNIVLFGPPGAGKGTQSENIINHYQLEHLSTGELLRKHLGENTALGRQAKTYIDAGNLVPDEVVIAMVKEKITRTTKPQGFIFDGFPRTVAQAEALEDMLSELGAFISGMIALHVPEEELKTRLLKRGETSGRSDDQEASKIHNRIQVYKNETLPVAAFYKQKGKFNEVHGVGGIDDIYSRIRQVVEGFRPSGSPQA